MPGDGWLIYAVLVAAALVAGLAGCRHDPAASGPLSRLFTTPDARSAKADGSSEKVNSALFDLSLARAKRLERAGDLDGAVQAYSELASQKPDHSQIQHRLAVLHDLKGDSQRAVTFYRNALKTDPQNPELLCDFGYNQYLLGEAEDAEKLLRQAIAVGPNLARAHNNLGLVLAHGGRGEEALAHFVQTGCSAAEAHINLAYALMWNEKWVDAARQIEFSISENPSLPAGQRARAELASATAEVVAGATEPRKPRQTPACP